MNKRFYKMRKFFIILIFCVIMLNYMCTTNFCNSEYYFTNNPIPENIQELLNTEDIYYAGYDGKIFYNTRDLHKKIYPASITKVITNILALDNLNLTDKITISKEDIQIPDGYVAVPLIIGEEVAISELINLSLIPSCNDATLALAKALEHKLKLPYSEIAKNFFMKLNLQDTSFTNPYGLEDDAHYTSLHDLCIIMNYAIKNDFFKTVISKTEYTFREYQNRDVKTFYNTNPFLFEESKLYNENVLGGKTGYTEQAQKCLITFEHIFDNDFIAVVCHSKNSENRVYISNYIYNQMLNKFTEEREIRYNEFLNNINNFQSKNYALFDFFMYLFIFLILIIILLYKMLKSI